MTIKALLGYLMQYASTLAIIAAAAWFIVKPHAENFIDLTVEGRFATVETNQTNLQTEQRADNGTGQLEKGA